MTLERALVAQGRPHMGARLAAALVQREAAKGCSPQLAPCPVSIEPPYCSFAEGAKTIFQKESNWFTPLEIPLEEDILRFEVWLAPSAPGTECDWLRSELFLKQLYRIRKWMAWEILGNEEQISLSLLCHREDAPLVLASFAGQFPECKLQPDPAARLSRISPGQWARASFREYYPEPPYSHLLTRPRELRLSPLSPFLNVLPSLPAGQLGLYQVVFAPVAPANNWHANVEILLDLEYRWKSYDAAAPFHRLAQQIPSADLHGMAMEADTKANSDKPMYAAVLRTALISDEGQASSQSLVAFSTFLNLFLHGGRPLRFIDETSFTSQLPPEGIREMFLHGLTHRPGFVVNTNELAGLVHSPPVQEGIRQTSSLRVLDGFGPVLDTDQGTLMGYRINEPGAPPLYCPDRVRGRHGHVLGKSDMGKSGLIVSMSLHDIKQGHGIFLLDPHGDTAQLLLARLPEDCLDRVIYFDPGDPNYVPLWNPLHVDPEQYTSRVTDEFVSALKKNSDGWGDRLSHILPHILNGLLRLGDATLTDAAQLLSKNKTAHKHLKNRIIAATDDPMARKFWIEDFDHYQNADIQPVLHKLGKLLDDERVARMFVQPETRIVPRRIMDEGRIFIADLSKVGPSSKITLGSIHMSLFCLAALSRSDTLDASCRRPFHMYVDEAHQFIAGALADIIAQTRKHQVTLTLAHQMLSQFTREYVSALGSTGYTVIFGVLNEDAERLARLLGGPVDARVLATLPTREAVVRIDSQWARIRTPDLPDVKDWSIREWAIKLSHERYYAKAEDLHYGRTKKGHSQTRRYRTRSPAQETEDDYQYDRLYPKEEG